MSAATKYEAYFRGTTPLFAAGASPQDHAELRVCSLKGALRFWWRALAWAHHKTLEELRESESSIFGGHHPTARAAAVLFKLGHQFTGSNHATRRLDGLLGDGLLYLGHGVWDGQFSARCENRRELMPLSRPCLTHDTLFSL